MDTAMINTMLTARRTEYLPSAAQGSTIRLVARVARRGLVHLERHF
jgi:hypothetical protein